MNNLSTIGWRRDDDLLFGYLRRLEQEDREQQYEQGIIDRMAEMLAHDASEAARNDVLQVITDSSKSHCYATAIMELLYARPLLASLDVPIEAKAALQVLIDAADYAELDARHDLEKAIRAGKV